MNILINKAKCLLCGDIIISKHSRDYVTCKCGNLSLDGGNEYARRLFKKKNSYQDLSIDKAYIEKRIEDLKQQHYSNRIEGAVDEVAFAEFLERAKQPISNEEFIYQEKKRLYAEFGLEYVK